VLGACSHCKDYSVEEEVIQWRNREQKRYEREQQALAASADNTTAITATADYDRRCRRCDRPAVTVVKVTGTLDGTVYPLGGWAYCTACLDTPHPTMQEAADA
jgi:predicted ATP-dependent serine protease